MRRPVDSPYYISTEFGVADSYALFGRHSGVDYALPAGRQVLAPVSGTLTNVVSRTGGNMVVILDAQGFTHRLMHNSSFSRANGAVAEGQEVAKVGTTGLSTGNHSHWDINNYGTYPTSFSQFISPADWLAGKYKATTPVVAGGSNVFNTREEVGEAYLLLRGVRGTAAEENAWIGQPKQRFFQVGKPEADSVRKQLADVRKTLQLIATQPPKEVIKEVIKIVEKPVEVIKEVPAEVDEKAVVTNWFKKIWNSLFQKG